MTNAPPIPPTVAAARTDQAWRAWAVASVQPTEAEIRVDGRESATEMYVAALWYAQRLHSAGCPADYADRLIEALSKAIKQARLIRWVRSGGLGAPPPGIDLDLIWSCTEQLAAATMPRRLDAVH